VIAARADGWMLTADGLRAQAAQYDALAAMSAAHGNQGLAQAWAERAYRLRERAGQMEAVTKH
jgi:hypothetical protein